MSVILHDKIYIPCEYIDEDEAKEKYTFRFYDEPTCRSCVFRRERHCADCESCEFGGFKGSICTMNYKTLDGQAYFGFPMGDLDRIEDKLGVVFEDLGIEDRTCKAKLSKDFKSKFKMTIDLYPYQKDAVQDLLEYKIGGLQSKPRTGKTTMACNLMTRTPYKILVIANQKDYLDGFIRELSEHTNIDALEAELGRKLYGFPKEDKDWEDFEIIMVTYQSLIQDTPKHKWRMDMLRKHRGLCILDEAHKSAATTFAKVMSQITSRMRIQLSGTFNRKDCLPAGHLVRLADGNRKRIEDIEVGDVVDSFNHDTGKHESKEVALTHKVKTSKRLIRVTHASGSFVCTEDHEVWSESRKAYVRAIDLTVDDTLKVS